LAVAAVAQIFQKMELLELLVVALLVLEVVVQAEQQPKDLLVALLQHLALIHQAVVVEQELLEQMV
jgi:hypothetical protein